MFTCLVSCPEARPHHVHREDNTWREVAQHHSTLCFGQGSGSANDLCARSALPHPGHKVSAAAALKRMSAGGVSGAPYGYMGSRVMCSPISSVQPFTNPFYQPVVILRAMHGKQHSDTKALSGDEDCCSKIVFAQSIGMAPALVVIVSQKRLSSPYPSPTLNLRSLLVDPTRKARLEQGTARLSYERPCRVLLRSSGRECVAMIVPSAAIAGAGVGARWSRRGISLHPTSKICAPFPISATSASKHDL